MWVKQAEYNKLVGQTFEAVGRVHATEKQLQALQGTLDWMTMRLTQLEHERAQLIHNYMGVKITVPEIVPVSSTQTGVAAMSDLPSFHDVGDEEAKRLGLGWDADGNATQHGQRID